MVELFLKAAFLLSLLKLIWVFFKGRVLYECSQTRATKC